MEDHSLITKAGIPRQLALRYFETLLKCGASELETVISWIQGATIKLSLDDCAKDLANYASANEQEISDPRAVLESLFSLEGLRASLEWSGERLIDLLCEDAKKGNLLREQDGPPYVAEALRRFFANQGKLERTLKAQRIYDGLLPNFESCSSIVEYRPVFDEERRTIVNGLVTASFTLQIRDAESGTDIETVSFQLDASDIQQMLSELKQLERKIQCLVTFASPHCELLNPTRSLQIQNAE
jgi:hypothetical protein